MHHILTITTATLFATAMSIAIDWSSPVTAAEYTMHVSSKTFKDGQVIPKENTADGADRAPQLAWSNTPGKAQSIAICVTDPDAPAGEWWHYIAINLPGGDGGLATGKWGLNDSQAKPLLGKNDFGNYAYNGPSPPAGKEHHYYFKVFALDTRFDNVDSRKLNKETFERLIGGHVLAKGKLMGIYKR
jgi:Raf kinase inhibitor-like YbhB/YbcL family protein